MPFGCECGIEDSWVLAGSVDEPAPAARAQRADELPDTPLKHITTGIGELDLLLGGGFVEESGVLVHGWRGSGKSRVCYRIGGAGRCLIVHPELTAKVAREIAKSTGARLERLWFLPDLDGWESEADRLGVRRVVLDSLGDVSDPVRAMKAARKWAQRRAGVVLLIQHTTKDGQAAGPARVAHDADAEIKVSPAGNDRARVRVMKARSSARGSVVLPLAKQ